MQNGRFRENFVSEPNGGDAHGRNAMLLLDSPEISLLRVVALTLVKRNGRG
jgi:hypothetical protein